MPTRDQVIGITVDGETIAGTIVTPALKVPGVLFVHGWGGSQGQYLARAREIAALGCVCLAFDLRGHAATVTQYETVTRHDNLDDVLAAYDTLVAQPNVDPEAIAVVGSSYGGYLAAILTTMRRVKWLGLRVPALYMDSDWDIPKRQLHRDHDLGAYRLLLMPPADNRALGACAEFKGDVLIIESEHDHIIPHAAITNYVEACRHAHSLTYRVLKGADHGLTDVSCQRAYSVLLVGWLNEMIFGARSQEAEATAAREKAKAPAGIPEVPESPQRPGHPDAAAKAVAAH